MATPQTPSFPEPSSNSGFSTKNFFRNRKVILTLSLVLLLVGYGAWARSGFSLEFFRFFASTGQVEITDISANPGGTLSPGETVTISWSTNLADDCNISSGPSGWDGSVPTNGSHTFPDGLSQTDTFTLECTNEETTANASVTVTIQEEPEESTPPPLPDECLKENINKFGGVGIGGGQGTATVKNNNGVQCVISLAAYEIWSDRGGTPPHYIQQQTLFGHQTVNVNPGETKSLSVSLPPCYSQVDLVIGDPIEPPTYHPSVFLGVGFQNVGDPDGTQRYCNEVGGTPTPTPVPTFVCPATAPASALATSVTSTSAVLSWKPGTGGTYQQLRVGSNQAEVNSGCQGTSTTCVVVVNNLPSSTATYTIPTGTLTPGTVYYWRIVNLFQGPPVCYKDAASQFTTSISPSPTIPSPVCPIGVPTGLSATVSGTTATLRWTPGIYPGPNDVNDRQMLRVGTDRQRVLAGCPDIGPQTCIVKEDNLPVDRNSYVVQDILPNVTYYWRVVNFRSATCYKDADSNFKSDQTSQIICSPKTQNRNPGEVGIISASGGSGQYVWSAPGGTPSSGTGSTFGTAFQTAGSHDVEVRDAQSTQTASPAVCKIFVVTPPVGFQCSPSTQTAFVEQTVNLSAVGGSGTYTWSAPGAVITTGTGQGFSTRYSITGTHKVTVTSGTETRTCDVVIQGQPTPPPTPPPTPGLTISKLVRNTTTNSAEVDVVSASPNDTVEFSIRVTAYNAVVRNARLVDVLPAGLSYVPGSTTVDGVTVSDGPTSASGIFIGDMVAGRTVLVRFRATVAGPNTFSTGTTTLTNVATATGDNVPPVSDPAFVNVTRPPSNPVFTLQKFGRNLTRGEFAEQNKVTAYPNNTIEFIIHIRSQSSTRQDNVILRDVLPAYITYIPKTTSIDGVLAGDGLTAGGLNIGSLDPGQGKVVRFSGRVASAAALPVGTTSVINTAQLDQPPLIAQLPVVIINGVVAGAGKVPTGAEDSVLAALLVSLLITLMYVAYTRTQLFKTRELKSLIKKHRGNEDDFDFKK